MDLLNKNSPVGSITVVCILLLSMWVGVMVVVPEVVEAVGTVHKGFTTANEVWDKSGNPHLIEGNFIIMTNHVLTVNPGVDIRFNGSYKIDVYGKLYANGTQNEKITMTHNSTWKETSEWTQIIFESGSHGSLKYCNISRGGNLSLFVIDISTSRPIPIENCKINYSNNNGIYISGGNSKIMNTTIHNCTTAIQIAGGNPTISNNTILSNSTAISITGGTPIIYENIINEFSIAGISVSSGGASNIYNNSINASTTGISITAGTSNIINNNITNCSTGISISSGASPKVWANPIFNSTTAGISISGSGSPEVYLNNISNSSIGFEVAGGTAKIHHNDIYLCQEGAYLNSNTGFEFNNNSINSCDYSISSKKNAIIDNCSIINSTIKDVTLSTPAHTVTTLNTSFPDNVSVASGCTLYKQFYLHVKVQDNFFTPVGAATVNVTDSIPSTVSYTTKASGWARWLRCTEKVFTNAGPSARTPHTISATGNGYNTTSSPLNMSQNRELTLTVQDILPPTSETSSEKEWYNTSMILINYSANDNAELKNIKLYYNFSSDNVTFTKTEVEVNSSGISGGTALGAFYFTFMDGDGYYGLYTRATDKNDKVEFLPAEADTKIGYDTKPARIIGFEATDITEDSEFKPCRVNVTLNDTLSGIGTLPEIRYKYDSTSPIWNSSYEEMAQYSRNSRGEIIYYFDIPAPLDTWNLFDGDYLAWEVRCQDRAGNVNISIMSSATKEYIDYVDHPPKVTGNLPKDKWFNHTIYVRIDAKDSDLDFNDPNYGPALVEAEYSIDSSNGINGTWYNISAPDTSYPYEFYWSTEGKVGTDDIVWIRARCLDLGGMYSDWNAVNIKIDNEPAVTSHDYVDYWHNSAFLINLTANDTSVLDVNGSGVKEIWYKINNGTPLNAHPDKDGMPLITTEGANNTLEYWSIDNQSNVERHNLLYGIKLDSTAPVIDDIRITNVNEYTSQEAEVLLFVNVTEELSGLKVEPKFRVKFQNQFEDWQGMVFVDGIRYKGIIELPLNKQWSQYGDKEIEIEIQCIDKADNIVTEQLFELVDKFELHPPVIEHTPVTTGLVEEATVITAKVTDNEEVTEVHLFYKAIGGTSFTSISMIKEGTTDLYSSTIPAQSMLGSVFYYIKAKDNNNNVINSPEVNPQLNPYEIILAYKDLDSDGLPDWWEVQHFTDISDKNGIDDPDADKLSNLAEYGNSTDPNKFDTDGDKIPDGWEIKYGLDPTIGTGNNGGDADPDGDGFSNYEEYKADTDPYDETSKPKEDTGTRDYTAVYIGIISIIVIIILLLTFFMFRRRGLIEEILEDEEAGAEAEGEEVEVEDMDEFEAEAEELEIIKPEVTTMPVDGAAQIVALAEAEACSICGKEIEAEGKALACPCGVIIHKHCVADNEIRECPQCGKVFDFETLGIKVTKSAPKKVAKPAIKTEVKQEIEELLSPPESAYFAFIPKANDEKEPHNFLQGYYGSHKLGKTTLNKEIKQNVSLFISDQAAKAMLDHSFQHGREKEVMGLILGTTYLYKDRKVSIAKDVATSEMDSSKVDVRFKNFDELFAKLETLDYDYQILGWYHTHPGHTCFMSPTDIDTQKRMFKYDFQHGVIIDPINLDMKAYTLDPKSDEKAIERGFAIVKYKDTF